MTTPSRPISTIYINNINEKIKVDDIKAGLYMLLSQCGQVIDVQAKRTDALRGQCWVSYTDPEAAKRACKDMNGFMFYNKPLRVTLASKDSDAVIKLRGGQPKPHTKRPREATAELTSKKRLIERQSKPKPVQIINQPIEENLIPNRILFVENLPDDSTRASVDALFASYGNHVESRLVPNRPGIAFVEYLDELSASEALRAMRGYQIQPDKQLRVSFAKR